MLIKYLSGPRVGQTEHVQNQIGQFAIGSGLAEEIPSAPDKRVVTGREAPYRLPQPGDAKNTLRPSFTVEICEGFQEDNFLAIVLRIAGRKEVFAGEPGKLTEKQLGQKVPDAIREEYARQWKAYPNLRKQIPPLVTEQSQANIDAANDLQRHGGRFVSKPQPRLGSLLSSVAPWQKEKN